MTEQETLHLLTLNRTDCFNLVTMLQLYKKGGSATAVIEHHNDIKSLVPDCPDRLANALKNIDQAKLRAEKEMEYATRHGISIMGFDDMQYPERLRHCDDAPLVLFFKGTGPLNRRRVINIVGTRHCTPYGRDCTEQFVARLKQLCPDTLIVSGLAYGVDICAHRAALANGMDTVAVLAHGLDYLYPQRHKDTAKEMLSHGGLLTEFFTNTNADKMNFIRRNRIVAGMADATILVESASHGGGLVTARIANSYNREVFAFPGKVTDEYSAGCNHLIRDNKAALINNADDFVQAMGWQCDTLLNEARKQGIERELFPNLTPEEQSVVNTLSVHNDLPVGMLAVQTNIPISQLTALLFQLEMKGVVSIQAGGVYHLLKTN